MIVTLLNTAWWFGVPTAHAGCVPGPLGATSAMPGGLDAAIAAAEGAFASSDDRTMAAAIAEVKRSLACAREPVPPTMCAGVHRVRALEAWLADDRAAAVGSLRGMLHADPRADLPSGLVPPRHVLRELLIDAEETTVSSSDAKGHGWLLIDGVRSGAVPVGQPYVVQQLRDGDAAARARIVEGTPRRDGREAAGHGRRALGWAGLGLGVASAGLYGGAWVSHGAYRSAVAIEDDARIGALHTSTNALSIGSVVAAGLGLGVASVLVFR